MDPRPPRAGGGVGEQEEGAVTLRKAAQLGEVYMVLEKELRAYTDAQTCSGRKKGWKEGGKRERALTGNPKAYPVAHLLIFPKQSTQSQL